MSANELRLRRWISAGLLSAGAAAGVLPVPVLGGTYQGGTYVAVGDLVVDYGESTDVTVWGHYPEDGYAFAAADFELRANGGAWSYVSDGKIVGAKVLDVQFAQPHDPAQGILADPSQPLKLWSGIFKPIDKEPRLVDLSARTESASYYPSEYTRSAVDFETGRAGQTILVNPVEWGDALAAPGEGTTIEIGGSGDDLLIGGSTGYDQAILIGMLLPAIQKVRIEPETPPSNLTWSVDVHDDGSVSTAGVRMTSVGNQGEMSVAVDWPVADFFQVHVYTPAADWFLEIEGVDGESSDRAGTIDRLPDSFSTRTEIDENANLTRVITEMEFDRPVHWTHPGGQVLEVERIEFHASQNNLKQLGLGLHQIEAIGTSDLIIGMGDGSVRSIPPIR